MLSAENELLKEIDCQIKKLWISRRLYREVCISQLWDYNHGDNFKLKLKFLIREKRRYLKFFK